MLVKGTLAEIFSKCETKNSNCFFQLNYFDFRWREKETFNKKSESGKKKMHFKWPRVGAHFENTIITHREILKKFLNTLK